MRLTRSTRAALWPAGHGQDRPFRRPRIPVTTDAGTWLEVSNALTVLGMEGSAEATRLLELLITRTPVGIEAYEDDSEAEYSIELTARELADLERVTGIDLTKRPTLHEGQRVRVRAGDFAGTGGRIDDIDQDGVWVVLDGEPALFDEPTATLFAAKELDLEETP